MRKLNNKYYLSVEGETEQWYFEHLRLLINKSKDAIRTVSFIIKPKKSPGSVMKTLSYIGNSDGGVAFHICDYESNDNGHVENFKKVLGELKDIRTDCDTNKCLKEYSLGYCNYTFDLWIALHKEQCFSSVANRKNYLSFINSAYNTKY